MVFIVSDFQLPVLAKEVETHAVPLYFILAYEHRLPVPPSEKCHLLLLESFPVVSQVPQWPAERGVLCLLATPRYSLLVLV